MKEKGFTLIELLAVIVILAIIALIATPIVLNIIEGSKKSAFVQTGNGIIDAAQYYYMKEMSDGVKPTENKVFTFNGSTSGLEELEFDGEIPKEGMLRVNVNGKIKLEAHNNKYCLTKDFEDNEVSIKDYDGTCEIPEEPICTLLNGEANAIGSKYQCKVKDEMEEEYKNGYIFYVLSYNYDENDNTKIISTNLIMERNICDDVPFATSKKKCTVAWNETGASGEGPVTAMAYLNNATSNWKDELVLNETYDDEGKDFTGFVLNGKARLPKRAEFQGNIDTYLYDYLFQTENPISGIYGYWMLSSNQKDNDIGGYIAWSVYYTGMLRDASDASNSSSLGVRPVITLKI